MHRFLLGQEELRTHCNILFCYKCFPTAGSTVMLPSDREMDRLLMSKALPGWGVMQRGTSIYFPAPPLYPSESIIPLLLCNRK